MTIGLAGGLTKPCKGILPAALTRIEDPPTAPLSLAAPKGAVFYALFYQLRPLMVVFTTKGRCGIALPQRPLRYT